MSEGHHHYADIDNNRVDKGYDVIDEAMSRVFGELKLNYYEALIVLSLMETKLHRNNTDQYLLESVTRFAKNINEEDEKGK